MLVDGIQVAWSLTLRLYSFCAIVQVAFWQPEARHL